MKDIVINYLKEIYNYVISGVADMKTRKFLEEPGARMIRKQCLIYYT